MTTTEALASIQKRLEEESERIDARKDAIRNAKTLDELRAILRPQRG